MARQKKRSLIVASTAAVGLFCVTLSQGFINGLLQNTLFAAIKSGLGHVQIRPPEYIDTRQPGLRLENAAAIRKSLRGRLPPNLKSAERIEADALLRVGSRMKGVLIVGLDPEQEKDVSSMPSWVYQGEFLSRSGSKPNAAESDRQSRLCLLGRKNAQKFEVGTGDWIVLTTGRENAASVSFRCTISGLFRSPSSFLDESLVLMNKNDLSRLRFGNPDEASYFVFLGDDHKHADSMKKHIVSLVKEGPSAKAYTFKELEPFISSYLEMTDQFTWIVYMIILMGFGIVLFESVTMSIFERIREIGIIQALGAGRAFLFWLVMFEAFLLTLGGAVLSWIPGLALMGLLSRTGVNFEGITMSGMSWGGDIGIVYPFVTVKDILTGITIAAVVSFFSGIFPAIKAVRMSPIKAIRG